MAKHYNTMNLSMNGVRLAYNACKSSSNVRQVLEKNPYKQAAYRARWSQVACKLWAILKDDLHKDKSFTHQLMDTAVCGGRG